MTGNADRAVSDVVAFALVFAMVISIVSATFVLGIDSIEALGNDGQIAGAERQMDTAAATFDDIHRHGSVARSVELELDGGTLEHTDSTIDVRVGGGSFVTKDVGALALRRSQGTIAYESGAVTRETADGANGIVSRAPDFYCGSTTAIISVVQLDPAGPISIAGDDSIRVIGTLDDQTVETSAATSVTVDVSTLENREAVRTYLDRDAPGWSGSGYQYTCSGVSKVVLRTTVIDLELQR